MRMFTFGPEAGVEVTQHGSRFVMSRLALTPDVHASCMYLPPQGTVGRHEAHAPQLFVVVSGEGWVEGSDGVRRDIRVGEAAYWGRGELHAAGTESGMTAIVLEGETLGTDPAGIGPVAPSG